MAQFRVIDFDNVRETFIGAGSTITKGGAAAYSRSLAGAGMTAGDTTWMVARAGAEISLGIFTDNGTTVSQTTVWYSSNSNNPVSFSSGAAGEIFCDAPARLFEHINLIEISVSSATTCDIGGTAVHGAKVVISGTTTITSLGTGAHKLRYVRFSGALTLTHHATSLILPGGLNITTAAGDCAIFLSDGSGNWRCHSYIRADGHPLTTGHSTIASATTTDLGSMLGQSIIVSGTTTITGFGSTAPTGAIKTVDFSGALILTHNATSLILPGAANITTAAGDCGIFRHEGSGNWRCISFQRAAAVVYHETPFTASGTFTTPSNSTTATVYTVRLVGGGGGGGGTNTGLTVAAAGAGGAGGYAKHTFSGVAPSTGITITIGAAGSAGANTGGTGGTGGSTSIGSPVSITVTGGVGGTGRTTDFGALGGNGGTVSAGSPNVLAMTGGTGGGGSANTIPTGGVGASGPLGSGGPGGIGGVGGAGVAATGYGAGGGGGIGSGSAGGAGSAGFLSVSWVL
jgi:hypothetical protein